MNDPKSTDAAPATDDAKLATDAPATDQGTLSDQDLDGVSGGRNVPDGGWGG